MFKDTPSVKDTDFSVNQGAPHIVFIGGVRGVDVRVCVLKQLQCGIVRSTSMCMHTLKQKQMAEHVRLITL